MAFPKHRRLISYHNLAKSQSLPPFVPRKFPKLFLEISTTATLVVISLVISTFGLISEYTVKFLILLLFICSISILLGRVSNGLRFRKYAGITFLLGFVIWYSYPAFVDIFLPTYQLDPIYYRFIDNELIVTSIIYLSLFLLSGVSISYISFFPKLESFISRHFPSGKRVKSRIVLLGAACGCFIGLLAYILSAGSLPEIINGIIESRALEKAWLQKSNLGDAISPFTFIASSAMVAGTFLFWIGTVDGHLNKWARIIIAIIALFSTIIIYFDQGTRSVFIMVVTPLIALKFVKLWDRSRQRALLFLFLTLIIIQFLLQFQVLYRASFSRRNLPELFFENWLTMGGTIDYFKETLLAVTLVPDYHEYFKESVILQFLFSPMPRFIWPDKPASQLVWFFTFFRWNIDIYTQSGNVLPGIVGQYYMSWGWIGPIMGGSFVGLLARYIDLVVSRINITEEPYTLAVAMMFSVWIFLSYRLISPAFLYPVLISAAIVWLSKAKVGRNRRFSFVRKGRALKKNINNITD